MISRREITENFGENIAVYGVGVTGQAVLDYLRSKSLKAVIIDDSSYENLKNILSNYEDIIARSFLGASAHDWDNIFSCVDTIVISPVIKLNQKADEIERKKNDGR